MFLRQLTLHNFKCLTKLELDFGATPTQNRQWTLLLGENGTGKSNLLKAIALITCGSNALGEIIGNTDSWITLGKSSCTIEACLTTKKGEERELALKIKRGDSLSRLIASNKKALQLIDDAIDNAERNYFAVGYGASRRLVSEAGSTAGYAEAGRYGSRAACQICNQSYKNDAFPTAGPAPLTAPVVDAQATDADLQQLVGQLSPDPLATTTGYKLTHYEQEHQREQALLLNPYLDDPTQYFAYEADEVTQEVTLVAAHPAASVYVTAAEQYYGLNRVELKTLRYKIYKAFRLLQRALLAVPEADLRADIAQQLQEMQAADYLFAGMNRYFATQPIPV